MTHDLVTQDRLAELPGSDPLLIQADLALSNSSGPIAPRQPLSRYRERSDGVTLLAFYHLAWSAIFFIGASIMAVPAGITAIVGVADDPNLFWVSGVLALVSFLIFALSVVHFLVTVGLWTLREWARLAAIALGVISLPTLLGTIPGALSIWYLMKKEIVELFN